MSSATAREVASQPEAWRRAAEVESVAFTAPARGARVAATGCGTSLFVAQAYAASREAAGHGDTDAFPASEFPAGRAYDQVLAISRSGTTTEVVRLLERLSGDTTAIVADASSPAATAAGSAVALPFADEESVVQTRFATSALALLRASLGEEIEPLAAQAEDALRAELPDPEGFRHFVFLGTGPGAGLANEAALKLREAAGAWCESYPAMEYRHGPISVATADTLVWLLDDGARDLAGEVRATGATVIASPRDPMAELVAVQRFAIAVAEARGLDPDAPRNLTRSVVL